MKDENFQPQIYVVKSENGNGEYLVTHSRPNKYSCTCRDFTYRSKTKEGYAKRPPHYCKHIKQIIEQEQIMEVTA